jgi:hypothetical protein
MTTWQALATIKAAQDGVSFASMKENAVQWERESRQILHNIGMRDKEIDAEFPMAMVINAIDLIRNHPKEFASQCQEAMNWFLSRN